MIGPGGLLLVVSHVYAHAVPVLLAALPEKKEAKLRHLILLSRLTYWAPLEMLLLRCLNWHNKLCGKFSQGRGSAFFVGSEIWDLLASIWECFIAKSMIL
jgi:hypothetical protein